MASPPSWLIPFLAAGQGALTGYQQEKERKAKEQEALQLLLQHGRNVSALQTQEYAKLPPAWQGALYGFSASPPDQQARAQAQLTAATAGVNPQYTGQAAEANESLGADAGYQGMGIPAFLGNPMLHGAAVANLANQVPRGRVQGTGRSGSAPKAFSVAAAVKEGLGVGAMTNLDQDVLKQASTATRAAAVDGMLAKMKSANHTPTSEEILTALNMLQLSPGDYKRLTVYH